MISGALTAYLDRSRQLGFLGPGPVARQIEHAFGMADAIRSFAGAGIPGARVLDLGAGGGVPGLVLAELWSEARFVMIDANRRRTEFLQEAVAGLDWGERVRIVCARAEQSGRDPVLRSQFDLVVARGFGPPAVTAECGSPFLAVGGNLAVSEPPAPSARNDDEGTRWPPDGCAEFGLEPLPRARGPVAVQMLRQVRACPDRYPRRDGLPAKRPLF